MSTALASPRHRIVVVDDDDAVLASLKFALEVEGFAVEVYRSAEELLAEPALPATTACVVVDYVLPVIDGLSLVTMLRERGVAAPAILITTNPSPKVRQRAGELDLNIVEKPLLSNTLAEAIRSALGS